MPTGHLPGNWDCGQQKMLNHQTEVTRGPNGMWCSQRKGILYLALFQMLHIRRIFPRTFHPPSSILQTTTIISAQLPVPSLSGPGWPAVQFAPCCQNPSSMQSPQSIQTS